MDYENDESKIEKRLRFNFDQTQFTQTIPFLLTTLSES